MLPVKDDYEALFDTPSPEYDPKVTPWMIAEAGFPRQGKPAEQMKFLLRYAVLAPSTHNSQPWKFAIGDDEIKVYIDSARWLRVADADKRELYASAGCAFENLLVAAEHFGYGCQEAEFPEQEHEDLVAIARFIPNGEPSRYRTPEMFEAIRTRHTNHGPYDGRPVSGDDLKKLHETCVEPGIVLHLTGAPQIKRHVDELLVRADATQYADPAYREELGDWIGRGSFGNAWLLAKLGQFATSYLDVSSSAAKEDADLLMSAPILGIIGTEENDLRSQVKAGQVYERVSLAAEALGLRMQPMNQVLQVPTTKAEIASLLPVSKLTPQMIFRLGHAPAGYEHTPRWPVEEFLV